MPAVTRPANATTGWSPPTEFDQFVIERPLGRGGMGHVHLGRDVGLDRLVALKFIAADDPSPALLERFRVEARAIAKLSHPNVVGVYRIGDVDGRPFIAYEFVTGESLDRLPKPLAWETALRLAHGIAHGLAAAHREGILHRDLKPANAMLSDRGEVKLLDFGLAKLGDGSIAPTASIAPPPNDDDDHVSSERLRREEKPISADAETVDAGGSDGGLTRPGTLMGTPAYIAPELWVGKSASTRSDVYAFGLVVYELLVGALPHGALDDDALAHAVIENALPNVSSVRPDVPESFAAIVDRCARRDPSERFASAIDLAKALDEVEKVFLPASSAVSAIPMQPDRKVVAASMARIASRVEAFTVGVYDRLFAASPSLRELFPEDMAAQRDKLAHALRLAIDGLAEPERLAPVLEDLGRRHVHYGVDPSHFTTLERALFEALAEHDAAAWTPELERAWRRAFAFIEGAMRRGMSSERATVVSGPALRRPRKTALAPIADPPRTRYAPCGELSLAYQVFGDGPVDLVVLPGWLSHIEIGWQSPALAAFLQALSAFARVIIFDKRGTGMSDRAVESVTLDDRIDDVRAALDHVGSTSAVLFGVSEGASTATLFAAKHPSRVRGVALYGAAARLVSTPDYPHGHPPEMVEDVLRQIRASWGEPLFVELEAPSMANDEAFRRWLALYMRMAASPGAAASIFRVNAQMDVRDALKLVRAPALVMHRIGDRIAPMAGGRFCADAIAGARWLELAGDDHLPFVGDTAPILDALRDFVAVV